MKKTLFLLMILIVNLLTISDLMAQDLVLADFDTTDPQLMVMAKWPDSHAIWQDGNIVVAYDTVPNPVTDGYNTSAYCMRIGQVENADWWGNFSGIALPNITASEDSMSGSGILVTPENHYLKIFVLRSNSLVGFRICVGTTENPSNGMDYTSPSGTCPFMGEGMVPVDKEGVWFDCVYDLTAIIGQHIRTVGIINSENWNNPRTPTPAADFYYDNFVLSDNPTPRDTYIPPFQPTAHGFNIGFEDPDADAKWYSDITVQDALSSYSIVDNTPDDVNLTAKALEFDKSASAPYLQSGPLFTLNGSMPTSTNQYLHVFVKVPADAIDPSTDYCAVQIIARNWQLGDSAFVESRVSTPDVWQDVVLNVDSIAKTPYITNFNVLFDCRLNSFGRPTVSPANTFYLDGIVLNNDPNPRTVLKEPSAINSDGDIVLADFDTTDSQPMVMAKWPDSHGIWQDGNIVVAYDTVPNPLTDGYNKSPYCMRVGQVENADWWGNFSGIALPDITASEDSCNGRGILVTAENHYLKMSVLRSNNLVGFRVCIGTTENPSNGMDYTSPSGSCPFQAEGVVPAGKEGVWFDCVYDLTAIIGQHIRTVGIINSENWNNPRTPTPAADFYYDNFVLSSDPTPRDVVVPPLQASSDGFYIGFEDATADANWYADVTAQDPLSSYSIVDNTPDDVNTTSKVMQFDKSASATANQSGPLFTLNGGMPTSTNQYLHVFVKVPEGAIDTNTGYCDVQIVARNWQVGDSAKVDYQVFDPDVWTDVVLPITTPIAKTAYISNFSVLFDCRLNSFGRPTVSPENTFYLDGIVLNDDPNPRTVLEATGIHNVQINNLSAFNSSKNTITVTGSENANIKIFNTIGQLVSAGYIDASGSQQFNVGQPGIYFVQVDSVTSKQVVKVLCK